MLIYARLSRIIMLNYGGLAKDDNTNLLIIRANLSSISTGGFP
jgi:hypothetical protein